MKDLIIFTDASNSNSNKCYYSSLFILDDEKEYQIRLKTRKYILKEEFHLKFYPKGNIQLMELYPILHFMKMIDNKEIYFDKINSITFYTDSQVNYMICNKLAKRKPRKKYGTIYETYFKLKNNLESKGIIINLSWIKAHCGVYGNCIADTLCNSKLDNRGYNYESEEINFSKNITNIKQWKI